jgi:post-segregation antitoxin (ccd killing protein)
MKNRRIVHILAALLTLDLATIGVTCSVYANYDKNIKSQTQTISMKDWGVIINTPINIITKNTENGVILTFQEEIKSIAAPGDKSDTDQNELIFTITGTPNVDIDLTCNTKITIINPTKWTIKNSLNEDFVYFPIRFTLGDDVYTYNDIAITTEDKVFEYNTSEVLKAGVNYNKTKDAKWEWDYENIEGDIATYDSYDTKLGNSFDNIEDAPEFRIDMTVTMEYETGNPDTESASPTTEIALNTISNANTPLGLYLSGDVTIDTEPTPTNALSGKVTTGDTFNLVLWAGIMAAAAVVITVAIVLLLIFNKKDR